MAEPLLVTAGAFLGGLVGCELVRVIAHRNKLLDHANDRSLHTVPTPRLGGVAIVVSTLVATMLAGTPDGSSRALLCATVALALLGLVDDVRPLSARLRIVVQMGLALAFVLFVGIPPLLLCPGLTLSIPSGLAAAVLVVWIVGVLNIYNFMDGMDGLAGSQAITAAIAFRFLTPDAGVFGLALSGSAAGFVAHNFPPARIFMGDAGSTFIGMAFAGLAVLGLHHDVPLAVSALPLAPFLLDGTFTIVRRALRREKVWQAHRTHLYQRAVQTGLDHRAVLLVYLAWMVVCLLGTQVAHDAVSVAIAWAVALVGLVVVHQWVVRREQDVRSRLAP